MAVHRSGLIGSPVLAGIGKVHVLNRRVDLTLQRHLTCIKKTLFVREKLGLVFNLFPLSSAAVSSFKCCRKKSRKQGFVYAGYSPKVRRVGRAIPVVSVCAAEDSIFATQSSPHRPIPRIFPVENVFLALIGKLFYFLGSDWHI